jgi:hypothetical protein
MKARYPIPAVLRFAGPLPRETQLSGRHVLGTLGTEPADVTRWTMPPHKLLANLPTLETSTGKLSTKPVSGLAYAKAMEAFVKKYGVLGERDFGSGRFTLDLAEVAEFQDLLRKAWTEDSDAIGEIETQVKDALEAHPSVKANCIELTTDNLWSLICVLFLLDHAAGKTCVCANPECPAPYFLRKRKDQKYCERAPCSIYAQRRYALGWWERKGYELRAKKSELNKRRK